MTKLYFKNYVLDINKNIYYPSDDTYLLLDTLKKEIKNIKLKNKCLEIGCGNSIISLYLYDYFKSVFSIDINEKVIKYLNNIKKKHNLENLNVINSNLFEKLSKNNKFDLIIFNPPYVCSEYIDYNKMNGIDLATNGGKEGSEIIFKFINNLNLYLNKNGICYLLVSSQNNLKNIYKRIINLNFNYKIINSKKLFFEELFILKINKII